MKPKVVILGGGYAGLQTALDLPNDEAEVILIDKKPCHELLPELPYRITETHLKTEIPFSELLRNKKVNFVQAQVSSINYQDKQVKLLDGEPIPFDYLVLALGSQTNYFNIPGLKENSIGFITTSQVDRVNQVLRENFSKAQKGSPDYKEHLSVVIGGGGLTGVEVAGELLQSLPKLAKEFGHSVDDIKIYMIEALDSLMPVGDKELSTKVTEYFKEQKIVELCLASPIKEAAHAQVTLADGRVIKANTIVWTGGIRANTFLEKPYIDENGEEVKWPLGRGFRVEVDDFYQVKGRPHTYAVGDNALIIDPETKNPFPLNGQAAYKQGRIVADYILADIHHKQKKAKKVKLEGVLVSLGSNFATGTIWNPFKLPLPVSRLTKKIKDAVELRYRLFDIRR